MCDFKEIKNIKTANEVQPLIDRVISSQSDSFTYANISEEIQEMLTNLKVSDEIKNSFQVDNMIMDTLTQMSDQGELENCSGVYSPIKMLSFAYA